MPVIALKDEVLVASGTGAFCVLLCYQKLYGGNASVIALFPTVMGPVLIIIGMHVECFTKVY